MITDLLPAGISAVEAFDDTVPVVLYPEEEAALGKAVEKRRHEFTTGRRCAREALAGLGLPPAPIVPGPNREPVWPAGVIGSITHCAGYRAAVVALDSVLATVGIDAEPNAPLPAGALAEIALPAEQRRLAQLQRVDPAVCWDRLLFSAKESVYKAWFPLAQRWLDFHEADIDLDPAAPTFTARLLVPGPELADGSALTGFTGRWLASRGLVISAIALPATTPRTAPARATGPSSRTTDPQPAQG
jgi:4'-phosphopantetheinyl transferase EntD